MIKRSFDTTKRSGGRLPTSSPSQAEGPPRSSATGRRSLPEQPAPLILRPPPPPIVFGPSPEWRSRSGDNPQQTATASSPRNPGPRPTRSFQGIRRSPLGPRSVWQSRSTANPRQTTTTAPSGSAESVGHLRRPTAPHFHGIRLAPPPPIVLGPCSERQSRSTANPQPTTTALSDSAKRVGSLRRPTEPSPQNPGPRSTRSPLGPSSERQSRSTANRQRTTTVPSGSAKSIGSLRILIGLAPSLWSQDVH